MLDARSRHLYVLAETRLLSAEVQVFIDVMREKLSEKTLNLITHSAK
jgi:hypothetical protein